MVNGKEGISAIVATVLIILVTVAGVTIVWTAIIPMIQGNLEFTDPSVQLSVDTQSGYTVFDEPSGMIYIQIKRGADDSDLIGLQIIADVDGNSQVIDFEDVPGPNQKKTYEFPVGPHYSAEDDIDIKVVPKFRKGDGGLEFGVASGDIDLPVNEGAFVPQCSVDQYCNTGLLGACSNGRRKCVNQVLTEECVQQTFPSGEYCSGYADDDCDGILDGDQIEGQSTYDTTDDVYEGDDFCQAYYLGSPFCKKNVYGPDTAACVECRGDFDCSPGYPGQCDNGECNGNPGGPGIPVDLS